jgi:hypothetical protein
MIWSTSTSYSVVDYVSLSMNEKYFVLHFVLQQSQTKTLSIHELNAH